MTYSKQTWQDFNAGGTPVNAERLNHMEDGIAAADGHASAPVAHTASNIAFTPTGTTGASNAQLAIVEVAADAAAALAAHNHTAASVTLADTGGYYTATDVEGALAELPGQFVPARNLPGVAANAFTVGPRSQITTFPAATFRPGQSNTLMALDVMPNGSPTENTTEGYAWIDICSTDIADNLNATTCAHVGIQSTKATFGSRGYGGSTAPNLWFEVGAGNTAGASLDSAGTWVVTGSIVVPFLRAAVGQPIIDLRTSGNILLKSAVAADKPCVVRGVASQSGNMLEVQDETPTARIKITAAHSSKAPSLVVGSAALATTATDGFIYAPSCAGTPTGVPTTQTGTVPFVIDTTASKLWAYIGGTWKSTTLV